MTWDIDPTQSFFRLTIPDQSLTIGTTTATIRLRDAGSSSNWTDAGGRMGGALTAPSRAISMMACPLTSSVG